MRVSFFLTALAFLFFVVVIALVVLGPDWVSSPMTKIKEIVGKWSWRSLAAFSFALVVVALVTLVVRGLPAIVPGAVMTGMLEEIENDIKNTEEQYKRSLPHLHALGYDVMSFKVVGGGWGVLPWAKLCLRSKVSETDQGKTKRDCDRAIADTATTEIAETATTATTDTPNNRITFAKEDGWLTVALVNGAKAAKQIQCNYKKENAYVFDTLVIEIDAGVPPKIKTSYTNKTSYTKLTTDEKEFPEPYIEGLDPACGQVNSGKQENSGK